jgi:hypothetical protein
MVKTFPARFRPERALAMGFAPDRDIDGILRDYIAAEGIRV